MADGVGATRRLGHFVARCADEELPREVFEKAALCLLDALGLTIIAKDERTSRIMRELATPARGDGTARIWADGTRAVLSEAVAANAVAEHAHVHAAPE